MEEITNICRNGRRLPEVSLQTVLRCRHIWDGNSKLLLKRCGVGDYGLDKSDLV